MTDRSRAAAIRQQLAVSRVYVLLDAGPDDTSFARLAETLVAAGASMLQLRDKRLPDGALLRRARMLRDITRGTPTLFLVNDRPDLARLASADGVHVGQEELSVADCRALLGPEPLVGVSTHRVSQVRKAVADGADYLGCGPTFPSQTKAFAEFPGIPFLRQVVRICPLPAFAIGGIGLENVCQVTGAGFRRIAVGSAVVDAADPATSVRRLLRQLPEPALPR